MLKYSPLCLSRNFACDDLGALPDCGLPAKHPAQCNERYRGEYVIGLWQGPAVTRTRSHHVGRIGAGGELRAVKSGAEVCAQPQLTCDERGSDDGGSGQLEM